MSKIYVFVQPNLRTIRVNMRSEANGGFFMKDTIALHCVRSDLDLGHNEVQSMWSKAVSTDQPGFCPNNRISKKTSRSIAWIRVWITSSW